MKRLTKIILLLIFSITLISCEKEKCEEFYPNGYGLITSEYAAIASLEYRSCSPYNVNGLTLEKYRLPSIWAIVDSSIISSVETVKTLDGIYYAKHINIGSKLFTAEVEDKKVKYQSLDNDDLYTWLEIEANVKWYCEQVNLGNVYFNIEDNVEYEIVIREPVSEKTQINWAEENDSLPDFDEYFPEYDSKLINQIFNRAYSAIKTITPQI